MEKSAGEAEALDRPGRKRADLAIQCSVKFEAGREFFNAMARHSGGKVVEPAKKAQVFPSGEASIKAQVASRVKTKSVTNVVSGLDSVIAGDGGLTRSGKKECRKNTQESGFAGPVCAEQRD